MIQDSCSKIDIKIKINKNKKLKNNNVAKKMNIKPIKNALADAMKAVQQNERAERTLKNKFHREQLIEAF